MEFFEEARKLGVPDIHITLEEWEKEYNNSYSVLHLDGSDMAKIFAAQDIIKTYLVLQARQSLATETRMANAALVEAANEALALNEETIHTKSDAKVSISEVADWFSGAQSLAQELPRENL